MKRRYDQPFGASVGRCGVTFRLWAPAARHVAVRLSTRNGKRDIDIAMQRDDRGWYRLDCDSAKVGDHYRFVIDGEIAVPDPASRFQPQDVHGPSEIVDPITYEWNDSTWQGRPWHEAVFYELHIGTFTAEGTYAAAERRFDHIVDLGVTAVELMPLSEAPGARNWGYDGVLPFAPEHQYGRPEDLKRFIDRAHAHGLMVFVDVVYNHFGPEGNYLGRYAPAFFTERFQTPWGAAIDFSGPASRTVRDFFIENALYWIEEFHADGLRLDAVHAIHDDSQPHFLAELAERVRTKVDPARHVHLVLENDENQAALLRSTYSDASGRYDAQWNDDFHHVAHVIATRETDGYYADYVPRPAARMSRILAEGFGYQGEPSPHRGGRSRGTTSTHLPPTAFISFIQNHDQVGNRAFGERLGALAEAQALRAMAAIHLLAPNIPLLFMGEEWNSSSPFPFFCDFGDELAEAVRTGRRREFERFPAFADEAVRAEIPDPLAVETFRSAKLDWSEIDRAPHHECLALYRTLLAIRRREIVPRLALPGNVRAEWRRRDDDLVDVAWTFADGSRLKLAASLCSRSVPNRPAPASMKSLYETAPGAAQERTLPPWFVGWYLSDAADWP